eukprot:scaffold22320_cov24-Cyclotella_meneghiniana.AAC.2
MAFWPPPRQSIPDPLPPNQHHPTIVHPQATSLDSFSFRKFPGFHHHHRLSYQHPHHTNIMAHFCE